MAEPSGKPDWLEFEEQRDASSPYLVMVAAWTVIAATIGIVLLLKG